MIKALGLIGLAMTVACCTSGSPEATMAPVGALASPAAEISSELSTYLRAPSIPFETVSRDSSLFAIAEPTGKLDHQVIRSEGELDAFLERRGMAEPAARLRGIDYSRSNGVIIVLENQPVIATQVDIVAVEERPDEFVVYPVKWKPRPESTVEPMMGVPHHFIQTKPLDKPVVFKPVVTGFLDQRPTRIK